ncbi:MAG: hypothetical protein F2799_04690 [Actinobacteria bacterium]|uniref:Unannotated protein n=1 Tax=freshwater metagenome TaxID=449393 RepID=A0A6J7DV83_9ZZZZ|nr:hypothetical protein [Actinomycetota bacterium]
MRRILVGTAVLAVTVAFVPAASAALVQQAIVKASPATGTGDPKGKSYVKIDSYLSTRDPASTRGAYKTNPVGKVFMTFPAGGTVNKTSGPVCNQSEYTTPAALKTLCASSLIGTGWALLNHGSSEASAQLTGAASYCLTAEKSTYMATYEGVASAGPSCLPQGDIWVQLSAYQGGIQKAQWWCYGDAGAPKPGAACNNKQSGGDATGKLYNKFNDTTNASKFNGCNIIFANDNAVAPLAFGGVANQCKNRLTVIIPALNGTGAGLGELTGGIVLTDFALKITRANYLKAGACPSKKTWTVSTQVVFSKLKGESGVAPPAQTVTSSQRCRV